MTPQASETTNGKDHDALLSPNDSGYFFLSESAADNLPNYVYQGEDLSLVYKYLLSPLASFLVENVTPRCVAPNAITLTGLVFMITSYSIFWYYDPLLEGRENMPAWIFLFHSCCMLLYQTLDNMDGKQARRTKSSSPLGLLFDHGCDAANSIFGSANWILSIGFSFSGNLPECLILIFGPMVLFYIATWQEYHTGKLVLPILNGPNEGLILGAMTSITTFLYGVSYWQSTSWFDGVVQPYILPMLPTLVKQFIPTTLTNAQIQVCCSSIGFVSDTLQRTLFVTRRHGISTLKNMASFWLVVVCFFVVDGDIWIRMPRTTLALSSGLFVEMCAQLMLDHTTHERYQVFRWTLIPLLVLLGVSKCGILEPSEATDDYLLIYTSALWAYLVTKMTVLIHEICHVLQIWCFDIVTPRKFVASNGYRSKLE